MSNEIYHHEESQRSVVFGLILLVIFISLFVAAIIAALNPLFFDIGLIEGTFLPIYTSASMLGIATKIVYIVVYLAIIFGFYFLFGGAKKVSFYADNGVLRKYKSWGMFSKEENYKISDVDYISITQNTLVGARTGRVFSASDTISLVMKGIDIKIIPIFTSKSLETSRKLAAELSKQTGLPIK